MSNIDSVKRFEIKEEHLQLLQRACISWEDCEFGAPCIDCKRPYGNSDVYNDISDILKIEPEIKGKYENEFSNDQYDYMMKLHKELETVLEIVLRTKSFDVGFYEAKRYSSNWNKVK